MRYALIYSLFLITFFHLFLHINATLLRGKKTDENDESEDISPEKFHKNFEKLKEEGLPLPDQKPDDPEDLRFHPAPRKRRPGGPGQGMPGYGGVRGQMGPGGPVGRPGYGGGPARGPAYGVGPRKQGYEGGQGGPENPGYRYGMKGKPSYGGGPRNQAYGSAQGRPSYGGQGPKMMRPGEMDPAQKAALKAQLKKDHTGKIPGGYGGYGRKDPSLKYNTNNHQGPYGNNRKQKQTNPNYEEENWEDRVAANGNP
mmetsp:Transcript_27575/g.36169  ORF Transcript_27575/g.36169 Transcript_27575/m.36169 type:complete len:255 (+) Transcript_27575:239-1003(+)